MIGHVRFARDDAFFPEVGVRAPRAVALIAVTVPVGIGALRRPAARIDAPWWSTLATLAIAVGFAAFVAATHSQQAILRRDAGSYAQIGLWLSQHPSLTAPIPSAAFGSADVSFASPGFYAEGGNIVPQF